MISKRYNAREAEKKWQSFWEKETVYRFDPENEAPIFSLDTPPPTVSGEMHLGHAMAYIQTDTIMRFQRMRGKNIFYPFGFDDNGLATELYVERKTGKKAEEMSRSDFIRLCLDESESMEEKMRQEWERLGISPDWEISYRTIDDWCRKTSQRSFIHLYKTGRAYRKEEPTIWCPKCGTAIAQVEMEDKTLPSLFYDITFKVGEEGEEENLLISTTRPELLPACVAVFYHPDDERYKKYEGKEAKVPLFEQRVPITADERANPKSGTGIVMCCTAGDSTDVEWWKTHKLPWITAIDEKGRMTENGGKYEGMSIKEARKAIVEDIDKKGLLKGAMQIVHTVNVHERCGTEVEYIMAKQWFIKYLDMKERFLEAGAELNWYPAHMKTRYDNWVKGLKWDWCISRQRYYGIPFPVWYCGECDKEIIAREEDLPVDPLEDEPQGKKCPWCGCGSEQFKPESDVLDTWATSSLTPQIATRWREDGAFFNKLYPMSLRSNGHDIITFWLFNTVVKGLLHEGEVPWRDVVINGFVLDPKRKKMSKSKSKGDIVRPQEVIEEYSADALRFWATSTKLGEDLPFEEKEITRGMKLVNKLWNATKFAFIHLEGYDLKKASRSEILDFWLMYKLDKVIEECTNSFERYEFSDVKRNMERFFWHTFCDNYLEMIKDRLYNPKRGDEAKRSAQYTLYVSLLAILKIMAPILPHITEEIYQIYFVNKERDKSIHVSKWPEKEKMGMVGKEEDKKEEVEEIGDKAVDVISAVRKYKSLHNKALNTKIRKLKIGCDKKTKQQLEKICVDLCATLHAGEMEFDVESKLIEDKDKGITTEKYGLKLEIEF
jgi:valyl-tRNA synthetase